MKLPFIEIIEAAAPDPNLMMWQFADEDKEIKNGARLTVRESQQVLFMNEGQLADFQSVAMQYMTGQNQNFNSEKISHYMDYQQF